ncbi:pyridoxamine 5'-phosphate oxidase family protein [Zoogloea sp.]|uniref:HugZ family pyridoxamine 5'-phosphate oxidase n=1 Tax=Zoogloea sp. TaxID=49181 RepID=UPI0014161673|nr:MAG: pyridoxamine 5'-phosphate oxidase [Zoogloea sp.]
MGVDPRAVRELLRTARSGALGTLSLAMPGYPFVSLVTFVPDVRLRPVFLLSGLAEHTRNLRADPGASLLLAEGGSHPLEQARLTLLGDVAEFEPDAAACRRFLRYSPESADYLKLGDFRFFRLEPARLRFIGGFARMGWSDPPVPPAGLTEAEEGGLLDELAPFAPVGVGLLGLDEEGLDVRIAGVIRRLPVCPGAGGQEALLAAAKAVLAGLELATPGDGLA